MAHEIHNNNFAHVGEQAWHGLGTKLDDDASLDQWIESAGFNWEAKVAPVRYNIEGECRQGEKKDSLVIYRSDNGKPLGVVSDRYKLVQPDDAMDFFREISRKGNYKMESAGMLYGGRKFWALAKIAEGVKIGGCDEVAPYILMATSLDGSMPTVATMTTIRVVCNNTLSMAVGSRGQRADVKVSHKLKFDLKSTLKKIEEKHRLFDVFVDSAERLAATSITRADAITCLADVVKASSALNDVLGETENQETVENLIKSRALNKMIELYDNGRGSDLETAHSTLWGVVNAATEYAGNYYGRTLDSRFNSQFFGKWQEKTELLANTLLARTH